MEVIKTLREDNNLKQKQIADYLGIKRCTYTSYEIERDSIPIKHLNELCNYFNISIDYALGLTKTKNYKNNNKDINFNIQGTRLKEIRKENKLTQKEIAIILNIARSTWTNYEYNKKQVSTLILLDLAKKYNYSIDYILGKNKENNLK